MTYKQYYHFINEIRKERNMTISSLCEGITSERTFMRYLKSNKVVRFDVLSKFCERLNIETAQVVHNAVFFRPEGNSSYKFIYRIQVMHLSDIEVHYQNVLAQHELIWYLRDCILAHVANYERFIGKIDDMEYNKRIKDLHEVSKQKKAVNAEILMIDVFYLETSPKESKELAQTIASTLLEIDFMSSIMFIAFAITRLLAILLKHEYLELEVFRNLVQRLQIIDGYVPTKYIQVHLALYLAYVAKKDGNDQEMKKYLFLYGTICDFLYGGKDYLFDSQDIKRMFDIDLKQLKVEKTKEAFVNNQFICHK